MDPKKCAVACAIHVSNSHTNSGWISEKKIFWPPNPHGTYPQVPPLGHDPGSRMKIPSDMISIFHLWVETKFGLKIFEIAFAVIHLQFWANGSWDSLFPYC